MQPIATNNAGMHCKVSCKDQFRRFLFIGTEFSSLYSQAQQLLSLNKEFVLKYKDNEGDLITISSNEELACALGYSEGNVLRLTAVPIVLPTDPQQPTAVPSTEFPHHFYGRGGRSNPDASRFGPEVFKSKLTFKRDMLQSLLAELAKAVRLTPDQQYRQSILQVKLRKIECRIAKFEGSGWEKHARKWEEKVEKHKDEHFHGQEFGHHYPGFHHDLPGEEFGHHHDHHGHDDLPGHHDLPGEFGHHHHGHHEKHEKGNQQLSEETTAQIAILQTQIVSLKPGFTEVKYQMKAKKAALKEAKAVGGNTEQLSNEIAQLKEVWKAQKNKMRPLKEQIYALKHAY